jgi:signal transduction histidine kinase
MNFGLVPAIRDLCESIESAGHQKIHFTTYGMNERLDNSIEIIVYRVVQECIGNILQHAQAKEIRIQLTKHEQSFMLMIEDDGVGFEPKNLKSDGMGLKNINARVRQLNGSVHIDSLPGKGTTTTIEIPLHSTTYILN